MDFFETLPDYSPNIRVNSYDIPLFGGFCLSNLLMPAALWRTLEAKQNITTERMPRSVHIEYMRSWEGERFERCTCFGYAAQQFGKFLSSGQRTGILTTATDLMTRVPRWCVWKYRVTRQADSNLLLISKTKVQSQYRLLILKRYFQFDVNKRLESTWCVTL